jgi:hypothetical protein
MSPPVWRFSTRKHVQSKGIETRNILSRIPSRAAIQGVYNKEWGQERNDGLTVVVSRTGQRRAGTSSPSISEAESTRNGLAAETAQIVARSSRDRVRVHQIYVSFVRQTTCLATGASYFSPVSRKAFGMPGLRREAQGLARFDPTHCRFYIAHQHANRSKLKEGLRGIEPPV